MFAFAGLAVLVPLAAAQPPAEVKVPTRYGVPGNPRVYPQADPKAALASAVKAAEAGRYEYLVAHLLAETFVEGRIDERARQFEGAADADLRALRQRQQQDPTLDKREQLPVEPAAFAERVRQEARARAFRQVVADVRDKLTEDPTLVTELRRFLREGDVVPEGNAARVVLKDVKDRQVFLTKAGDRWFVENRQQPAEKPAEKEK
jgi:hypothetical protein